MTKSFDDMAPTFGSGSVGMAFAAVGSDQAILLGNWTEGVAWSTIKVPLAVAAIDLEGAQAYTAADAAVTASDNVAAEQLWSLLGPPERAAAAVEDVLRQGGDAQTQVESRRVRAQFTAFGQTAWSIERQTVFTAHLPCISGSAPVLASMSNLIPGQQWGLASLPGSAAKAGWGPGVSGDYLIRQIAVLPNSAGHTAVALAVQPRDGSFATGITMLDRMTEWIERHREQLPSGNCQP